MTLSTETYLLLAAVLLALLVAASALSRRGVQGRAMMWSSVLLVIAASWLGPFIGMPPAKAVLIPACLMVLLVLEHLFRRDPRAPFGREALHGAAYAVAGPMFITLYYYAIHPRFVAGAPVLFDMDKEGIPLFVQGPIALLSMEFVTYWRHRAQHHSAALWEFHKVHHSVEHLSAVSGPRDGLVGYLLLGFIPTSLVGYVLGLGFDAVFYFWILPAMVAGYFQHMDVRMPFPPGGLFSLLLIHPEEHRWHHTKDAAHGRQNLGSITTLWDRLFGTYYRPEEETTEYGLVGDDEFVKLGFVRQELESAIAPFLKALRMPHGWLRSGLAAPAAQASDPNSLAELPVASGAMRGHPEA